MSASLLKKGLRLFEEEVKPTPTKKGQAKTGPRPSGAPPAGGASKPKQATLKDKKIKSAIDNFIKKNPKTDRTAENLALLDKISLKTALSQTAANKISSYQLQKQRKAYEQPQADKRQATTFTEDDFLKFEREYFVK